MKQLPFEDVLSAWEDDHDGEYIGIAEDGIARYIAHGRQMEEIPMRYGNVFAGIRVWMKAKGFYPNIWSVNDHGNVALHDAWGKTLGGIV